MVLSARAVDCATDADERQLEAITLMAQPLPYRGFEGAFLASIELEMRPDLGGVSDADH